MLAFCTKNTTKQVMMTAFTSFLPDRKCGTTQGYTPHQPNKIWEHQTDSLILKRAQANVLFSTFVDSTQSNYLIKSFFFFLLARNKKGKLSQTNKATNPFRKKKEERSASLKVQAAHTQRKKQEKKKKNVANFKVSSAVALLSRVAHSQHLELLIDLTSSFPKRPPKFRVSLRFRRRPLKSRHLHFFCRTSSASNKESSQLRHTYRPRAHFSKLSTFPRPPSTFRKLLPNR